MYGSIPPVTTPLGNPGSCTYVLYFEQDLWLTAAVDFILFKKACFYIMIICNTLKEAFEFVTKRLVLPLYKNQLFCTKRRRIYALLRVPGAGNYLFQGWGIDRQETKKVTNSRGCARGDDNSWN